MNNGGDLWPGLDLRHLAAFQSVATTGSFAQAAQELGYTQPAISQQISALERIIGQRLFDRSSGRPTATLTEAGTLFLDHAADVLARIAVARSEMTSLARGEAGLVRVAAFQTIAARILPGVAESLRSELPAAEIEFTQGDRDLEFVDGVARGAYDFAFAMLPVAGEDFEVVELVRDPYYLVAESGGAFDPAISTLADLDGVPLIGYRTCRSVGFITEAFHAAGVEPQFVFRSDDNFAVKGHLQRGVGVALIPRMTLEMMGTDGLHSQLVGHLVPPRRIALVWSRHRLLTPVLKQFIVASQEVAREIDRTFVGSPPTLAAVGVSEPARKSA